MISKFLNLNTLIEAVDIKTGMSVADYGSSTGALAVELAKKVGKDGEVLAVDILESAISVIKSRIDMEGMDNIKPVRVDLEVDNSDLIPNGSLDVIFLVNVLFQSKLRQEMIQEVHRALKPDGKWIVVDWSKFVPGLGPNTKEEMAIPDSIQQLAEASGFRFEKDISAGEYHWGKVFSK